MEKYLIMQACESNWPNLKTDPYGTPLKFWDYSEAEAVLEVGEQIVTVIVTNN